MAEPVVLVPLLCTQCKTPLAAQPGELAWACPQCQQGLLLDENQGLQPLVINYHAAIPAGATGLPYWVAAGSARLARRVYGLGSSENEALQFWSTPRRFFVPAYSIKLDKLLEVGPRLLLQPPALQPGPAARFTPVSVALADVRPLAEFIVMGIEAGRKDKLKELSLSLTLETPALWILPA